MRCEVNGKKQISWESFCILLIWINSTMWNINKHLSQRILESVHNDIHWRLFCRRYCFLLCLEKKTFCMLKTTDYCSYLHIGNLLLEMKWYYHWNISCVHRNKNFLCWNVYEIAKREIFLSILMKRKQICLINDEDE